MIGLSHSTSYAILALGCLNDSACECRQVADLARCSGVPKAYLAKVLNVLVRRGLLTAKRGYRGGVALARGPERISLLEIVEAIEGERWIGDCLVNLADCGGDLPCPLASFWQRVRKEITAELRRTTLADVIASKKSETTQHCEPLSVRRP